MSRHFGAVSLLEPFSLRRRRNRAAFSKDRGKRASSSRCITVRTALAAACVPLVCAAPARGQTPPPLRQLNEQCTVSVLNRNVRVHPDGSWVLPNVPANFGLVRARATCIVDGETISDESEPFLVPPNGVVNLPRITFSRTTPIPQSLTMTAPATTLTQIGGMLQLAVTANYADGSQKDV